MKLINEWRYNRYECGAAFQYWYSWNEDGEPRPKSLKLYTLISFIKEHILQKRVGTFLCSHLGKPTSAYGERHLARRTQVEDTFSEYGPSAIQYDYCAVCGWVEDSEIYC